MKFWIDDLREPPSGTHWVVCRNSADSIFYIDAFINVDNIICEEISFDHDLGGLDTTRPVVLWMIENLPLSKWPKRAYVHTANPVGAKWLRGMLTRYGPDDMIVI